MNEISSAKYLRWTAIQSWLSRLLWTLYCLRTHAIFVRLPTEM